MSAVEVSGATQVFDGLVKRLTMLNGASVKIGVLENTPDHRSRDGDLVPMVTLAAAHELGRGVPERSFLRAYADGPGEQEMGDAAFDALGSAVDGDSPETSMEKIGEVGVDGVKRRITDGIAPALKRETLENPDRDPRGIPLVDTGQLFDAIRMEVEA